MGRSQRAKGRRGESAFASMLTERDYEVIDTTAGKTQCDIVAIAPDGTVWAFEVKNRLCWDWTGFYRQARESSGRMRWGLALHIPETREWLIVRQGEPSVVWRTKEAATV